MATLSRPMPYGRANQEHRFITPLQCGSVMFRYSAPKSHASYGGRRGRPCVPENARQMGGVQMRELPE